MASLLPAMLGRIIDAFATNIKDILNLIVFYIVLFMVVETLTMLRRTYTHRLTAQFCEQLCNQSLWKLLRLPKRDLEGSGVSGELTSRINQAVSGASQLLRLMTNDVVPTFFLGTFTIWQCIRQSSPIFALIMLAYIILSFIASYSQIRSQMGIRERIIDLKAKFDGEMCQSINGIEQIRALGAEHAECQRLAPQTRKICATECHHHTTMGVYDVIKQTLKALFFCTILIVGLKFVADGQLSGGQIIAVIMLFQQLTKPIDDIYRFLDEISASSIKVKILKELTEMTPDGAFTISNEEQVNGNGNIRISQYKVFAPSDSTKILSQGGPIEFKKEKSTAIVAKTGGGKSSLLKGLLRLYPLEGIPEISGVCSSKITQHSLTELLHYVPQSPFFFAGSVKDNLAFGLENISDSELVAALKLACLYDELEKDGDPLSYSLQEAGRPLSGGQIKRMAIARAFLRSPRFYLMDEVFTGIDNETTTNILNNLDDHVRRIGAGIIHVTHDDNIIRKCDEKITLLTPS
jgi:ABC-type bacteriocin/lantibiotic exporter with double-glycine peptidase domain